MLTDIRKPWYFLHVPPVFCPLLVDSLRISEPPSSEEALWPLRFEKLASIEKVKYENLLIQRIYPHARKPVSYSNDCFNHMTCHVILTHPQALIFSPPWYAGLALREFEQHHMSSVKMLQLVSLHDEVVSKRNYFRQNWWSGNPHDFCDHLLSEEQDFLAKGKYA
jgi:hypothetical protein